jgi:hypothetical protein
MAHRPMSEQALRWGWLSSPDRYAASTPAFSCVAGEM